MHVCRMQVLTFVLVALVIASLNAWLLFQTFAGWMR